MRFTLEIECDNAAFEASPALEVQRILRSAARRVEAQGLRSCGTSLFDGNGNRVGQWTYGGCEMNTLPNRAVCYQAITTRFYGPTNFKPARLKVVASAGHKWHSWDSIEGSASGDDRHIVAAKAFADSMHWTGDWYMGGLENGGHVFVNCPSNVSGVAFTTKE